MEFLHSTFASVSGLLFIISACSCAKILYLPFPLYSHVQTATWLRGDLQAHGHELWIAFPGVLASRGELLDPTLNVIKYDSFGSMDPDKYWIQHASDDYLEPNKSRSSSSVGGLWHSALEKLDSVLRYLDPTIPPIDSFMAAAVINNVILSDSRLLETIRQHDFDLILIDGSVGMPYVVIPYKLDIPFCFLGTFFDSWRTGTPTYPSFSPIIGMAKHDVMNFRDRLISMFHHFVLMAANPILRDSIVSQYAPEKPYISLTQLIGRAEMFLLEQDILLDFPRATMPNTKCVGGLSVRDAKPLQGKLKTFYDMSSHGVVLVTFGGSSFSLPSLLSEKLRRAFTLTKYAFVWRSNMTSKDDNILMVDWLPQNDILGHPDTRLFITHCGAYGQFESMYHGVPMVGLPVYADQHYNSRRMELKNYGVSLDVLGTAEDIAKAISKVIETPMYTNNIKKAAKIFKDRPLTPRKEAAYWIDHVIKYGGTYFRSAGLDLPWYQFLCVDVFAFFIAIAIVQLFLGYKVAFYMYKSIFKTTKRKVE